MRTRAWAKVKESQPMLLIGSPMFTAFSAWQRINNSKRDPEVTSKEYARGLSHLKSECKLYEYQAAHGRYFLHERPAQATSWCTAEAKRIMDLEEVGRSVSCPSMSIWSSTWRSSNQETHRLHVEQP